MRICIWIGCLIAVRYAGIHKVFNTSDGEPNVLLIILAVIALFFCVAQDIKELVK